MTQIDVRGCKHDLPNSGFKIQLHANADVIQEWVSYSPDVDINSLFIDEKDNGHPLQVWKCPFNDLRIVLKCSEKLKDPSIQLTLKDPQQEKFDWKEHSGEMKYVHLKSGKVIVYSDGCIGYISPGMGAKFGIKSENWDKK